MNPFGVHHEPVTKAYKNIMGRLGRARQYDKATVEHSTMGEKMRGHALEFRQQAGLIGSGHLRRIPADRRQQWLSSPGGNKYGSSKPMTNREARRELKQGAQGLYDAIGREGRAKKVLP